MIPVLIDTNVAVLCQLSRRGLAANKTNAPILNEFVLIEGLPALCRVTLDVENRLKNVFQSFTRIPHKGVASESTRSRIRLLSPRSVTTSTLRPRNCRSSITSPPKSSKLRPGSIATRRSMSLSGRSSPRATDPKTRTSYAPCLRAICSTCCRFDRRISVPSMTQFYPGRT